MSKRKIPHHVLPVVPGSALDLLEQKCVTTSGVRPACGIPEAQSSLEGLGNSSSVRCRTRSDQPPVTYRAFGSRTKALAAGSCNNTLAAAVCKLEKDFHSSTSKAPRDSRVNTWERVNE